MNKCAWGNLADPKVYVDPESLNNSVRPKTNFMRAAQALTDMGRNKQAIELLDAYQKHFPDSQITYDMYMLPYAEIYYKAGANAKADALLIRVAEIYTQNLDYYDSYSGKDQQYFEKDIQMALGMIKRISDLAAANKQTELAARMDSIFQARIKGIQ
jgi:tetratricopeptide (TPR) repeat protein